VTGPVLHILVVDDEPPIRRLLRTSLTALQYKVSEAADGAICQGRTVVLTLMLARWKGPTFARL